MKKIIASGIIFMSMFTVAEAQTLRTSAVTAGSRDVNALAIQIKSYFNLAIEMMLAAAIAWVIWSAFKFVLSAGDEEKRAEGRSGIIYGVIGIAVMVSVWGLVSLVTGSTGLTGTTAGTPPLVN